ncbi:MAG TPA: ISL3 family transposase [Ktedonobacterales bacterium]|nr:ISL3 family transposase [Ktedonobacterales bacterium]
MGSIPQDAGASEANCVHVPLGLTGLRVVGQHLDRTGQLAVHVRSTTERAACSQCDRVSATVHDTRWRPKRDLPCGEHPLSVLVAKRRFWCRGCARTFTEPDTACGRRRRSTVRFRAALGAAGLAQPVEQVAAQWDVGPQLVRQCVEIVAQARLEAAGTTLRTDTLLPTPRWLGIDEFARRKGQRYDTILCDLEHRRVLDIGAGRTQTDVAPLLERLDDPAQVAAVSMDMSRSFREAVHLCLPRAQVVADHFHVVQHVGKAVGKVFRRCARTAAGRAALRGQRHLFVRRQETLTPDEQQARQTLAEAFPDLAQAWQAKEALRTWYATATAETAEGQLTAWVAQVEQDAPAELRKALSAFQEWRDEILAFFRFLPNRLSNGFVEGKNNRTKALMRQAYGYRNRRHLRLRILLPT